MWAPTSSDYCTWCLELWDSLPLSCSPFLPAPSLLPQHLKCPWHGASPCFPCFSDSHEGWVSLLDYLYIHINTQFPLHTAALSRSSWTWKFSKCHPSAHTRHTYACPHLHTPWIFLFNEGIHCINLASFSFFYMQEHKHIKIKTLFSKSHSHKSGLEYRSHH